MNKPVTPEPTPTPEAPVYRASLLKRRFERIVQLLKYFIISSVILTTLEIGYAYWLISSRWHLFLPREQMIKLADEVNAATPVHPKYMEVYTKLFPNHVHTTLSQQIFLNYGERIFLRNIDIDDNPHCACDLVYDIQVVQNDILGKIEWDGRIEDVEYGFGVEKFSTPEKCFAYTTNYRIGELRRKLDPLKFGHLVNKSLDEYSDDDFIELMILLNTKRKINRYKNPRIFEEKLQGYREKLAKARAEEKLTAQK